MRVASLGVVARNTKVEIDCSAVTKVADVESPLQAELMAIVFGLHMAKERNFRRVQLESDSLIAVTEILKKNETLCEWDGIISDILDLSLDFESCSFSHVYRVAKCSGT